MQYGFHLYIDEAGDDGIAAVRPRDPNGSSEYFVLAGVLIRSHRRDDVVQAFELIRERVGLLPWEELHFRKLTPEHQALVVSEIAKLRLGLIAIVSNKRNMRGHRNRRVEAKEFEVVRGRTRPKSQNFFYNHLFRYLLERASRECARYSHAAHGPGIKIVFSHRDGFSYSQTKAYLHKLKVQRRPRSYFNNKRQVTWSSVDISGITSARARKEPMLQLADVIASAVYKAIDEDRYGDQLRPEFIAQLGPLFLREHDTPRDYGFKLLPDGFSGPLSSAQKAGLMAVGYRFPAAASTRARLPVLGSA